MKKISLLIPENYLKELDVLVEQKMYPHRSEAIRLAVRDLLLKKQRR